MLPSSFVTKIRLALAVSLIIATAPCAQKVEARTFTPFEKALEDIDNDRFTAGEEKFKRLIEENPKDAAAHTQLSRVYMRLEKSNECCSEVAKALALDPKQSLAYTNRSYFEFKQGHMQQGFADAKASLKYYHVNPYDDSIRFTHKNLARAYKLMHEEQSAKLEMAKAQAYDLLDDAYKARELGRLENGIKTLGDAIKRYPNEADFYFLRGVLYNNQSKFGLAIVDFTKALQLDPEAIMLYYFRADSYAQAGLHKQAIEDLTKIIQANPRLAAYRLDCETGRLRNELLRDDTSPVSVGDIYFLRSQSYTALGKTRLATIDLNTTCKLNRTDDKALAKRAEISMLDGRSLQAIADYTKSVNANPKDWARYVERADAYMQIGKKQEALADFAHVIKLNPTDPGAYTLRAVALKSMGKYGDAAADFSKVLEMNPTDDDAWMERSDCYRQLQEYTKALADLKHISPKLHQEQMVVEARAKIYSEMKRNDKYRDTSANASTNASGIATAANISANSATAGKISSPSFTLVIELVCAGVFGVLALAYAIWRLVFAKKRGQAGAKY